MATRKKKTVVKGKKATKPVAKNKARAKPKVTAKKRPAATRRKPPMHAKIQSIDLSDDVAEGNDETFEVFKSFDRDGSGSIDRGEFARLLEALGMDLDEDELEVAVDMVDSNRSGRISWTEFQSWWSDR
jgi:hypothetical protein